jgi:hypothetical protein
MITDCGILYLIESTTPSNVVESYRILLYNITEMIKSLAKTADLYTSHKEGLRRYMSEGTVTQAPFTYTVQYMYLACKG